ncbi:hypothetical protein Ndes2437B_g02775 [Nannochloris sp. 'desiccata']
MAIKPKDLKFEEAALRKRLEFVKSIKAALKQEDSITAQTVEAYTSIIDEIIKEVAQGVHRAVKTGVDDLHDIRARQHAAALQQEEHQTGQNAAAATTPALPSPFISLGVQMSGSKGAVDMFGNQVQPIALDQVSCPVCRRQVAAGRFAPHLEKCMGKR